MEVVENSVLIYEKLKEQRYFHENGCFFKRYTEEDDLNALSLMEENKGKLTEEFYSMILKIHKYQGEIIGLESCYHENYQTLLDILMNNDLNLASKRKIFLQVVQVLEELKNIGVDYWDLHSENILIKEHIKFIDLSSAISNKEQQEFSFHYYRLLSILLEMYLFYDDVDMRVDYVEVLLRIPWMKKYFSSAHFNWMKNINDFLFDSCCWEELLDEFQDEEKVRLIRQNLKENGLLISKKIKKNGIL